MNKKIYFIIVLFISTIFVGCSTNSVPDINPRKYINLCACSAAMAAIKSNEDFDPVKPVPDNPEPTVRPPKDCETCSHRGWLGDGRPRSDCPDCDANGDGSNEDPMSVFLSGSEEPGKNPEQEKPDSKTEEENEFSNKELGLDYIRWTTSSQQAINKAKSFQKPIIVVLENGSPSSLWDDDNVIKEINESFVPLFGDITDESVGVAWATQAKNTRLVESKNGKFKLKQPILAILSPQGTFTSNNPNDIFYALPNTSEELIELVKSLK